MDKKSKLITYAAIGVVLILLLVLAFVTKLSNSVPGVTVYSEGSTVAEAIIGGYTWNSFLNSSFSENVDALNINYNNKNILLVKPGEKITLRNSGKDFDVYKFSDDNLNCYDDNGKTHYIDTVETTQITETKSFSFYAPKDDGSYVIDVMLNYHRYGNAQYSFKIIVSSMPSYSVEGLLKYKNTYIGDAPRVNQLLNALPYKESKDGIILRTTNKPYELIVYYKNVDIKKEELFNNTVAIFALIDNVDIVTYELDNKSYIYTREELETILGRDITEYASDSELWKKEVLYNLKDDTVNSNLQIYKSIFSTLISKISSEYIVIDVNSFDKIKISDNEKRTLLMELMKTGKSILEANNSEIRQMDKFKGILLYANSIEEVDDGYRIEIVKYDTEKKQDKIVYNVSKDGIIK